MMLMIRVVYQDAWFVFIDLPSFLSYVDEKNNFLGEFTLYSVDRGIQHFVFPRLSDTTRYVFLSSTDTLQQKEGIR